MAGLRYISTNYLTSAIGSMTDNKEIGGWKAEQRRGYQRKPVVLFSTCLNAYHWQKTIPHYLQFLNTFKISNCVRLLIVTDQPLAPLDLLPGWRPPVLMVGSKNSLRADKNKARPFLPGIEPRFLGRPARSLVTNSIPPHATVPTKVPLRLHAPRLGKETHKGNLSVFTTQ